MLFGPVSDGVAELLPSRLSLRKMQHGGHMQITETKGLEEELDDEFGEVPDFGESKEGVLVSEMNCVSLS